VKGHLRQRGADPKAWSLVVDLGRDPVTGKRRQKWVSFHGTKRQAQRALNDLLSEIQTGSYIEPTKETFADFSQAWLRDYAEPNLRPATHANYEQSLRLHAFPIIGNISLASLRPADIQQALKAAQDKGLAPKTVRHVHTAIHRVLSQAVSWGMLARNPAELVTRPRVPRPELSVWGEEQAAAFLESARSHRLFAVFWLAIATGMRRGEVLGLSWRDVDLERGRISISRSLVPVHGRPVLQEPKSPTSIRAVAISPETVAVMREHHARQKEEQEFLGLPDSPFVFTSVNGNPVDPRGIHRVLDKLVIAAGVPRIRFHDLRHTCATLMLRQGTHPKVVSERLGHKDIGVTLNIYSHLLPDMQQEAAALLDSTLARKLIRDTKVSKPLATPLGKEES